MSGVFKIPYAIKPLRQFGEESASLKQLENKSNYNMPTDKLVSTNVIRTSSLKLGW